ncbi:hypothetical protein [Sanguibacter sp. HDW7]|uniref:hypothetical protein n=1 Tax=Sanguibacter sp. HDW7 TaxID=2714931 RepID=UPI001408FE0A|nr:hypothetical protein [Sanguibacter sp. HDW7]QIK82458.1 hypothetical protein G7063_01625 [Sanguibacter sp. HDW7]
MIRLLIRMVVFLGATAIGLLIANLTVSDMRVGWRGCVIAVVIVAVLQSVLAAWFTKIARDKAPVLTGAAGLLSTFLGLLTASLLVDDLTISGVNTWFLATVVTWLGTLLGALLLPTLLARRAVKRVRAGRDQG